MKTIVYNFILISLLISSSCGNNDRIPVQFELIDKELNPKRDFVAALVIPEGGCPGCISIAEDFFKDNYSNPHLLFIFTRINSLKELRAKTKIADLVKPNIVLDSLNRFSIPPKYDYSDYPAVIIFDNEEPRLLPIFPGDRSPYDSLLAISSPKFVSLDVESILDEYPSQPKLSDNFRCIEYVRLDPDNVFTLDAISKVYVTEDRIFITEAKATRSAYIFDRTGKAISRIECRGRGPDECVAFSEIGIDEPNREVLVPDYLFSKVLVYDFDGNLKRILKTNYRINSIQVEDTLYFLRLEPKVFAGKDIRCVVAVNRDFEIVRDSISCITTPALDYIIGSHFTESNNGVYINEPYNDTLFSINTELQSIPVVSINRGKYSPPPEIIKNISNYISLSDKYVFSLYYFVDFPDCYFRIMFNQEYIIGKVSMLNGRSNIFYRGNYISGGYTDDIEGGPDVIPRMSFRYGIQYSIIEPLHLFRNEYNSVVPGSELSKLKEVVKRDDNPILRIFWPR